MGNGISGEVDKSLEVTGNIINKVGLPRPAAITENKRHKSSVRPPGATKPAAEDLPFIQARFRVLGSRFRFNLQQRTCPSYRRACSSCAREAPEHCSEAAPAALRSS